MEHKENTLEKKLAIVFAQYPKPANDILYSTHDERIFLSEGYAKSHAFKMKDTEVTPHRRSDYQNNKLSEEKSTTNPDIVTKTGKQVDSKQLDLEREALKANYLKLYGKAAQGNIGIDKLKVKIAEKEAELAAQLEKDGSNKESGLITEITGSETDGAKNEGSGKNEEND
ncbi:hypothetical protein KO02_17460 [Sphingobacterium sp. ML3W]|uniref:hypothetical protein n=1 Tax=Sphingobacterium sp. ML3W TaxID=1538644 RepID=UPI0004F8DF20|nr:hypothetical protein [Sphingobacterium sp. ML3W]AIM38272.1 hypothetical protein KO02_17460 [Sphingobacterium sp. ML3W]